MTDVPKPEPSECKDDGACYNSDGADCNKVQSDDVAALLEWLRDDDPDQPEWITKKQKAWADALETLAKECDELRNWVEVQQKRIVSQAHSKAELEAALAKAQAAVPVDAKAIADGIAQQFPLTDADYVKLKHLIALALTAAPPTPSDGLLMKHLDAIFAAADEFKETMFEGWEGDPIQWACDAARAAIAEQEKAK